MADWVAPIVTGLLGAAGIAATWYTGQQARDHAERLADKAKDTALKLALADKRLETYPKMLQIGFEIQQWVNLMRLHMTDQRMERPQPNEQAWAEVNALAAAHASKPVGEAFIEWRDAVLTCRKTGDAYMLIQQAIAERGGIRGDQPEDLYDRFKPAAEQADAAYKLLANKISVELTKTD